MGKRSSCGVSDAWESPSADAKISIKGLETPRLVTTLEKWETQAAPTYSGFGSSDGADESESGGSDIESGV